MITINHKINDVKFVKAGVFEDFAYDDSVTLEFKETKMIEDKDLGPIPKDSFIYVKFPVSDLKTAYVTAINLKNKGEKYQIQVSNFSYNKNKLTFKADKPILG